MYDRWREVLRSFLIIGLTLVGAAVGLWFVIVHVLDPMAQQVLTHPGGLFLLIAVIWLLIRRKKL